MYDPAKLRSYYDRTAPEREALEVHAWKRTERARFLDELRARDVKTLLELGSGPGKDSLFFKEMGFSVTAADLSPEMVTLCRARGIDARVMDLTVLDFGDERFDAVYTFNSLLHVPKTRLPGVLADIEALLPPGGLFYFGVWGGRDFEGIYEADRYEPKRFFSFWEDGALLDLVAAHFELLYFRRLEVENRGNLHFQSLILRKS